MKPTIDEKVATVIRKENKKLSSDQKNYQKVIDDIQKITGNLSDSYTIVPKDTIGKSIRFNVGKQ